MMNEMADQTKSIEVMINEYNALKDFRKMTFDQSESRVNLYLKMLSVAIVAIPAFSFIVGERSNNPSAVDYTLLSLIVFFAAMILLYVGIISFYRVIESNISCIRYTRALNRVRRFFYDNDKSIRKYLSLPVVDDLPIFGTFGFSFKKQKRYGSATLLITLNAINWFFAWESFVFFLKTIYNIKKDMFIILSVAILLCTVIYYLFLHFIYGKRIKQANDTYIICFPSNSINEPAENNQ